MAAMQSCIMCSDLLRGSPVTERAPLDVLPASFAFLLRSTGLRPGIKPNMRAGGI
jgi:hypothetical protein